LRLCFIAPHMLGTDQYSSLPSTPTIAWGLIKKLIEKGNNISIITNSSDYLLKDNYPLEKVQIFPIIPVGKAIPLLKSTSHIVSQIKKIEPDVIHTYGDISMSYFAILIKTLTKKPTVITVTRNFVGYSYPPYVIKTLSLGKGSSQNHTSFDLFKRKLLFTLDHIICCNNFVKQQITGKEKVSDKISVVPHGIKNTFLVPIKHNNFILTHNKNKTILFLGDGSYSRGFYIFLFSIKDVLKEFPRTRFIAAIRGMDYHDSIIAKKIERNCNNLTIIDKAMTSDSLLKTIKTSDIIVLPFKINAMEPPLTIIESMSMGKPVITTNVGGNKELITNMVNGILINPNSAHASKPIISLLRDDQKREKMGQLAQQSIRKKYNWNECANKILSIYETIKKDNSVS